MDENEDLGLEERIRLRAYRLWQEEGCPEGREKAHWALASEMIAYEDDQRRATQRAEGVAPPPSIAPREGADNAGSNADGAARRNAASRGKT